MGGRGDPPTLDPPVEMSQFLEGRGEGGTPLPYPLGGGVTGGTPLPYTPPSSLPLPAIGGMYLLGPLFPLLLTAHFPSEMVNNEVQLK